jgi:MFS family permease
VPFALEHAYHQNPGIVGAQLAALPLALGAAAPVAGSLAGRIGARPLTVAGMLAGSAGLIMVAVLQHGPGLVAGLAVLGVGLGAFTPSNNTSIMASARPSESGVASGLLNMTRGLGTALGVALTGLVYEREGFVPAMLFLVAIALLAALLAALRPAPAGRAPRRLPG